jgi:riboflavin-specific deaminase-like protein
MGDSVECPEPPPLTVARRLLPTCAEVPPLEVYADLALPAGPPERPYVVLNTVSTVDGKIAVGGRAGGIGSRLDRDLMRRIRAQADGVMLGASTLRAERVDPTVPEHLAAARSARDLPAQPLAVTVSATLDLDPTWRFFRLGLDRTLILTTTSSPPDRVTLLAERASVERIGGDAVDLAEALRTLRTRYGVERLVVEGGPTLNGRLFDLDVVDELFLTIAPKLAAGSGSGSLAGDAAARGLPARLELVSLYSYGDELFARYRVAPG